MAIRDDLTNIQTAKYGKDVRSSIVSAISQCYTDVTTGAEAASTAAAAANAAATEANRKLIDIIGYTDSLDSISHAIGGDSATSAGMLELEWVNASVNSNGAMNTGGTGKKHASTFYAVPKTTGEGYNYYSLPLPSNAGIFTIVAPAGYAYIVMFRSGRGTSASSFLGRWPDSSIGWYCGQHSVNLSDESYAWHGATHFNIVVGKTDAITSIVQSSDVKSDALEEADLAEIASSVKAFCPISGTELLSELETTVSSSIVGAINSINSGLLTANSQISTVNDRVTNETASAMNYALSQINNIQNLSAQWEFPKSVFTYGSWRWTSSGFNIHPSITTQRIRGYYGVYVPEGTVVTVDAGYAVTYVMNSSPDATGQWLMSDRHCPWTYGRDGNSASCTAFDSAGYVFLSVAKITYSEEQGTEVLDNSVTDVDISEFASKVHITGPFIASKIAELFEKVSDPVLPVYFENEVERVKNQLETYCTQPSYVIGFVTDSHYSGSNNWDNTIKNLKKVNNSYPLDCIIHGGDLTTGNRVKTATEANVRHIRDTMLDILPNVFILTGNHDDNSYYASGSPATYNYDQIIDAGYRYSLYGRHSASKAYGLSGHNAWYWDVESLGLRIICLDAIINVSGYYGKNNGQTWGYSDEEVTWFESALADAAIKHLQVAVFSHMPFSAESSQYAGGFIKGSDMAEKLDTFADNNTVIGLFHGHTHWDYLGNAPHSGRSFLEVSTGCSKFDGDTNFSSVYNDTDANGNVTHDSWKESASGQDGRDYPIRLDGAIKYNRTSGTKTEELWDIIVITPGYSGSDAPAGSHGRVKMIRFGAGVDREFFY